MNTDRRVMNVSDSKDQTRLSVDGMDVQRQSRRLSEGPVECLGMVFENDEARKSYFLDSLREKLADPEFRKIEGFPIGEDENILILSDPPYYTACPNPFIRDFLFQYRKHNDKMELYKAKPYAGDLTATRNNPFVNAHSYATKVPHEIVIRLILNYTKPGDIILDAYAGTGMTGVAAQLCGDVNYLRNGRIDFFSPKDSDLNDENSSFNQPGNRLAIIGDLCPAASFIAANLNLPFDESAFDKEVETILKELDQECGWMYKTRHISGGYGNIICTIWSDVFICPECGEELSFWDVAVNEDEGIIQDPVCCPTCSVMIHKDELVRSWTNKFDCNLNSSIRQIKQVPVIILYEYEGERLEKKPDNEDLALLEQIENYQISDWYPTDRMPAGEESRRNDPLGITHIHHFFTKRNLAALACAWRFSSSMRSRFMLTSLMYKSSILCAPLMSNYFAAKKGKARGGWVGKERSGTLYCPSIHSEVSIFSQIQTRKKSVKVTAASNLLPIISTSSATKIQLSDNSVDYIFTDPPFGANKMYSELNFMWESWLKIKTDNNKEAIMNKIQLKGILEYQSLMSEGFSEYFRILKPNRWITIEFSNTRAAVWNALQNALMSAGFIVADVRSLDKKQGSIMGYTTTTAPLEDLAISAYKPNGGLEDRFALEGGTEEGVWDFLRTHLSQLPIFISKDGEAIIIAERHSHRLFDRMVAFHLRRGATVPLSATEFYTGLAQRFPERDGMYFLPEQAAEYDKKRMNVKEIIQLQLSITDEASAIQWIRQQLAKKPQTLQELTPAFMKELAGWSKHEKLLELRELLEQNFIMYEGEGEVPSPIHSYLSTTFKELRNLSKIDPSLVLKARNRWYIPDPRRAGDLEKLREKALLKEFHLIAESKKRIKEFRIEAVRAGFKKCWDEGDHKTILDVAKKLPTNVVEEDSHLLMYTDLARMRQG